MNDHQAAFDRAMAAPEPTLDHIKAVEEAHLKRIVINPAPASPFLPDDHPFGSGYSGENGWLNKAFRQDPEPFIKAVVYGDPPPAQKSTSDNQLRKQKATLEDELRQAEYKVKSIREILAGPKYTELA